jgi:hypothetical protein
LERRWRHLHPCGFATTTFCRVPRVRTAEGQVETLTVPWAGPRSRWTLLDERFAIEVLLAARGVSAAADLLGLSWDQMHGINGTGGGAGPAPARMGGALPSGPG